jgi:hypothetical protein
MSLLINGRQLEVGLAIRDENHPMHQYALEYTQGLTELREKFGNVIKFIRPGFPKKNRGSDSKGNEVMMNEPTPPALFPLEKSHPHPNRGEEVWSCCLNMPKLLPNGLWSIGNKKSLKIEQFINVDINKQPDLAYYLYYIADFGRGGRLKVDDPQEEIRNKAAKERQLVERKTAIWQMLSDENVLRKMASAYGVPFAATKSPDALRFDLEAQLESNDKNKIKDNSIKGTMEFLEEMKVTDNVRLRAFLQKLIDDNKLVYKQDGRYRLGDKVLMQVPQSEINKRFEYLCSYYNISNNQDKLQELMRDVVNKEFLDGIKDDKDITWLSKVMGINTPFKKKEELRSLVYDAFSIAL